MNRSNRLYPGKIQAQCTEAINTLGKNVGSIDSACMQMQGIIGSETRSDLAVTMVKGLFEDLRYVAQSQRTAIYNDMIEYSTLASSVGNEDLNGVDIKDGQVRSKRDAQRYERTADSYRNIPYTWTDILGNSHTGHYTDWGMVNYYMGLADNCWKEYHEWVRQEELYDTIEASTRGILAGSSQAHMLVESAYENIESCISGTAYWPDIGAEWRKALPEQNERLQEKIIEWNAEQQRLAEEAAAARKEEGFWTAVKGIGLVVAGGLCIVATCGAATPIVVAGLAVGVGTMAFGIADCGEGIQDCYYGSIGDIETGSYNVLKDGLFQGNEELYNIVESGFAFTASAMCPIGSMAKAGTLTLRSGAVAVGKIAISDIAGAGASKLTAQVTDNRAIQMFAGMAASNLTGVGLNKLDVAYGWSSPKPKTVKTVEVNGKKVILDNDTFDPSFVDKQGRTNIQRMEQGLSPIGTDGKSVNIHHIDQTNDGPVMEITATNHQQNYNDLHTNTGQSPSQIDRNAFNSWRNEYWKWRANNLD